MLAVCYWHPPENQRTLMPIHYARSWQRGYRMGRITGAHHTSFTVADLERSLAFFRDQLGLEVVFVREIRDAYFGQIVGLPACAVKAAVLRIPGSAHFLELFEYLVPKGQPQRSRPCDP